MSMHSKYLQRQLRVNADSLCDLYDSIAIMRRIRKDYMAEADKREGRDAELFRSQGVLYTPEIKRLKKRIKALEQLQKALKRELQEAYTIEHFEKTWEAMPDVGLEESFLAGRVRMAAEDGFVEPGVVLDVVEVK